MRRSGAVLLLGLLVAAGAGAGSAGAQPAGRGRMTFVAQTPWVAAGGLFQVRVHVDRPAGASNLEFALTVFPAVATRSDFGETLADRMGDTPLIALQPVALADLRPEANGDVVAPTGLIFDAPTAVFNVPVAESHRNRDLVPAEGDLTLGPSIRRLEKPVVPRVLVVVQDDFAIQLVEFTHR